MKHVSSRDEESFCMIPHRSGNSSTKPGTCGSLGLGLGSTGLGLGSGLGLKASVYLREALDSRPP